VVLAASPLCPSFFSFQVRHFTNACTRILGLEARNTFERGRHCSFEYQGRLIALEICPAGIDPHKFAPLSPASPLAAPLAAAALAAAAALSPLSPLSPLAERRATDPAAHSATRPAAAAAASLVAASLALAAQAAEAGTRGVTRSASALFEDSGGVAEQLAQELRALAALPFAALPLPLPPPPSSDEGGDGSGLALQLARRRRRGGGQVVVLLAAGLDWCKGLPQMLVAVACFFQRHPGWRRRVTVFVVVRDVPGRADPSLRQMVRPAAWAGAVASPPSPPPPPPSPFKSSIASAFSTGFEGEISREHYQHLLPTFHGPCPLPLPQVSRLVGFVNGRYGSVCHQPVVYVHRTLPPAELASLYAAADVALVGSIREGVNLAAMEFVAAQSFSGHDEKGVLLYSEFAGCASSFQVQRRARARERRAVCTLEYTFLFACCSYSPTLVL
jgi:hypothetical protein